MDAPPPPPPQGMSSVPVADGPPKKSNTWIWILVGGILICGCGGLIGGGAILFPIILAARSSASKVNCLSNMKQLGIAEQMYQSDYDDHFADRGTWIDKTATYTPNDRVFTCPAVRKEHREYGYAASTALSGKKGSEIKMPTTEIDLFETSKLVRNANGDPNAEGWPSRHGPGRSVSFVDGHAHWVRPAGSDSN
jgi:prepilin-type processing-associated H-X9-DG protein